MKISQLITTTAGALALLVFCCISALGQTKIVGGTDVPTGTYPWMCALVDPSNGETFQGQFCGGSLIAS